MTTIVQVLSPYGYPHYENQMQPDGKMALTLVPGDIRLPLVAQKYNKRFRSWTDILALDSKHVRGYAMVAMTFDEKRPDEVLAMSEIKADASCVRLDGKASDAMAKVAAITKCDAKVLEAAKSVEEVATLAKEYLKVEALKPIAEPIVEPIEEPIEKPAEDVKPIVKPK
jgi:hypothetical protein